MLAAVSACDFQHDSVAPGCYGEIAQAGRSAAASTMHPSSGTTAPTSSAAGAPTTSSGESGGAGTAGSSTTMSSSNPAPAAGCDLTGHWLYTMHKTTDGLGNLQYAHNYLYYEIEQRGDAFTVKKGLHCGLDVVGGGTFAITVDYHSAWAGIMKNVRHDGRTGSSAATAGGCKIDFAKQYMVEGATIPYYLDPSTTLPSADEMASGSMPGWEDWDGDGNPGITGTCSGTVTGKIFTATREWSQLSGTVSDVATVFKLPLTWDQEPNVMGFDGSPFLGSTAVRAADASLHFVQLARLSPAQATGDDAAICKSVVELAPMLTPEAAGM